MCLHQFKYTGKRQIAGKTGGKPGTAKAMTLPARMQPPYFSGDSPVHSGSSSVGRDGIQHIGTLDKPCLGSGDGLPASHSSGLGLIPGQSV